MNQRAVHEDDAHDEQPVLLVVGHGRALPGQLAGQLVRDYRVASALDIEEALATGDALHPDLILADLTASAGGRSWIRALRSRSAFDSIPILVVAKADRPEELTALLEDGAQDILRAPFLAPELAMRLDNLVSSKRARDLLNDLVDRPQRNLVHLAASVAHQQRELWSTITQMQASRSHAENASRMKSSFLRSMSHELKTPLTAMQLQLELLERDPNLSAASRLREGHARIRRSARRLLNLIDTMLEWTRVESGRARPYTEPFDLVSAVEDVVRELSGQAQQKRLAIEVHVRGDLQREMVSDRRLLMLVLVNLVGRALQLTPAGKIEVCLDQLGADRRVVIKDAAPQRAVDDADPFEPMRPGGSVSGVALYVLRDIARAIGAELMVEHTPGKGHVLTLSLPSIDTSAAEPAAASGGATGTHHPHA